MIPHDLGVIERPTDRPTRTKKF